MEGNQLFPVYLKLNQLKMLLVGGGNVAHEKLTAILGNSPETSIHVVAKDVSQELLNLVSGYPNISISTRAFASTDLDGVDLAVIATNNPVLNEEIRLESRTRHLLINVADKPELCDFYLGSIVKKGDLKIGISTNGKSPTIAKRLKELLNDALPEELEQTLHYMSALRNQLKGDFQDKVRELNEHTASLLEKKK